MYREARMGGSVRGQTKPAQATRAPKATRAGEKSEERRGEKGVIPKAMALRGGEKK